MTPPLPSLVKWWPLDWRDAFGELAGRIQHTGLGCSREESEARAEVLLRERHARWGDGPVWTTQGAALGAPP